MKKNNYGVSEVVSTLLTLAIVLGVVTALLFWGLPYIEERKILSETSTLFGGFDVMYDTMSGLILQGHGAKGFCNIVSVNDKGSLNVETENKKLILSYTFTPPTQWDQEKPKRYDFNVTDLEDEDDSFNVIFANTDDFNLNKVQIYWLDPGQSAPQYNFETTSYRNIYQNTWAVQPFKPPADSWHLNKTKIYVMKRGLITSDLNVSIYSALTDQAISYPLAKEIIPAASISSSYDWIECDFDPDVQLDTATTTYYLGINTSGGSFGGGSYNCYQWYLDKESFYSSPSLDATTYDGSSWSVISGYDFGFRLNFSYNNENLPPDTPIFVNTYELERFVSGVNKQVTVKAIDPDPVNPENIIFKISWGDGSSTVSPPCGSSEEYTYIFNHIYARPGNYTLTLQAKNDIGTTGYIYSPDNITKRTVRTGDYLPEDLYRQDFSSSREQDLINPNKWKITTTDNVSLDGTLRIDLFGEGYNNIAFGRIWVFDLGSITYESPHDIGTQRTFFQNGAILTIGPTNNAIIGSPSFFEEDNAIGFRIIQINNSYTTAAGGTGTYKLNLKMKNSFSREPRVVEPNHEDTYDFNKMCNIKMQFFDPIKEAEDLWVKYFTSFYDFETFADRPNTIFYPYDGKHFVLDNSYIEVNVEGAT